MLADRLPLINAVGMIECVLRAYTVLVRIAAYRGLGDRVEEMLHQATQLSSSRGWLRLETMVLRERVRTLLLSANPALAETCIGRLRVAAGEASDKSPALQSAIRYDLDVSEALLDISRGGYHAAADRLRGVAERAIASRNKSAELECAAGLAAALQEMWSIRPGSQRFAPRCGSRLPAIECRSSSIAWSSPDATWLAICGSPISPPWPGWHGCLIRRAPPAASG